MQKYEAIQKLSPIEFRRLTGVRKETFVQMISIVKKAEKQRMSLGGKPFRLVVEDKLRVLLHVHLKGDSGSPREVGSTSVSKALISSS